MHIVLFDLLSRSYCLFHCHSHNNSIVTLPPLRSPVQLYLSFALRADIYQYSLGHRSHFLNIQHSSSFAPFFPQLTSHPQIPKLISRFQPTPSQPNIKPVKSSPEFFVRNEAPPQFPTTRCLQSCPFSPSRLLLFSPPQPMVT